MTEAVLHYNRVARTLHWTIGLLVIANLAIGIFHDPLGDIYKGTMGIHKSIGFTVLVLSLFRLYWRLTHPAPPLPATMPAWEKISAHSLHWIFYALLIIMPMTGWAFSSAGKYPLEFFGLFDIPKLAVEKGSGLAQGTHNAHVVLGFAWAGLLVIHIGAALRHHFILKDNILLRMWRAAPGRRRCMTRHSRRYPLGAAPSRSESLGRFRSAGPELYRPRQQVRGICPA